MNKNRPRPAATFIRKYAKKYLNNHEEMSINELKEYIQQECGYEFTIGEYAGALRTLIHEPGYKTIRRGIYTFESVKDIPLLDNVNNILDQTIIQLRKLGIVDLLQETDSDYLESFNLLKQTIEKLEELKIKA